MGRARSSEPEDGQVASLNHDGAGVVHGGRTAFVAGALPGETVRFLRRKRRGSHDEAELLEVLVPSPLRITAPCAHFAVCGGCALQHLDISEQLAAKSQQLRDALQRLGKVAPQDWLPPIVGPAWGYRRRARLGARYVTKLGRSLVGFRERRGSFIADLERCAVLASPVDDLLTPLSSLLTSLAIRERVPQIEVAVGDNATALVLRVLDEPGVDDLARMRAFEQRHGVEIHLQPKGLDSVRALSPPATTLHYRLDAYDLELEFLPTDFVQINGAVNAQLIAAVREHLCLDAESRVLDLFCGLGNFSLPLARHAAAVVGVEGEAALVARASHNAAHNNITNAMFLQGNLFQLGAADARWSAQSFSHVLLDPPRAGAREVLPLVAGLKPRRLVYVSCHPATLARDLGLLVHEHGFELEAAGIADMFPHTAHVESVAVLRQFKRVRHSAVAHQREAERAALQHNPPPI
jgi:23S rRNA (uracil1939-C5)-methyltransferase